VLQGSPKEEVQLQQAKTTWVSSWPAHPRLIFRSHTFNDVTDTQSKLTDQIEIKLKETGVVLKEIKEWGVTPGLTPVQLMEL